LDSIFPWDRHEFHSIHAARYLRKTFTLLEEVQLARVYISGLGMFELYVNGQKIGDQVLFPASRDYTQNVKYTSFDLKPSLHNGGNAVGVTLGNGRLYNMRQLTKPWKIRTFGMPKLLFQLELTLKDGSKQTIVSDESWKITADGPIRANNEWDGEIYDATKEMPGWSTANFDDSKWLNATLTNDPGENRRYFYQDVPQNKEPNTPHGDLTLKHAKREGQLSDPMKVMQLIKPKTIKHLNKDTFIMDMGQNFAGRVKLRVQGPRGNTVSLHYAEYIEKDGHLYFDNLSIALNIDRYTHIG